MSITRQQALDCFASDDLIGIGMEADALRRHIHPEGVVSYTISRSLDNPPSAAAPSLDNLYAHVEDDIALGITSIRLPDAPLLTLDHYEALLTGIKQRFPHLHLHGLSATQILALATAAHISLRDTLLRLRDVGLDSIDSDAILFNDDLRRRFAPHKCSVADWITVHRAAHQIHLSSTATMVFGLGESIEQRIDHLEILRSLQQETGGFTAFTPVPYQPAPGRASTTAPEPTAVEYLTTLAISRLYLDTVPNIQGSWPTQGLKVLQMGLRFGSNDVGSVLLPRHPQDRFAKPGGATEEELRRIIREAGFQPAHRDILYRSMYLN